MKFNKQIAIILVLLSMLLSAIAVSIYFYNKSQQTLKNKNKLVRIFIAKDNIKRDTKITKNHIKETTVAKQYVLTKPLLKKEILNKYAKETIYKNEAFLKEKLSIKINKTVIKKTLNYKYNSYNMPFRLFKNPDYSLEPDDIITIMSVYPIEPDSETVNYSVQYVAKDIRVLGFLNAGKTTERSIIKKKLKKLVKNKQVEKIVTLKSEEIILDIKEDVLLNLMEDYNKGKQLWMMRSRVEDKTNTDEIEEVLKKEEIIVKKTSSIRRIYKPKSYPIRWYLAKNSTVTKSAKISYSNDSSLNNIKKVKITSNYVKACSEKNNLLLSTSRKIYLRKHPSIRAKIHKKISKNYILPYISVSKINPSWYMICDGSYIQRNDVEEISYQEYKNLKR